MTTQTKTQPKPAPKAKAAPKAKTPRLPAPPPRLRTPITKPTKAKAAPKAPANKAKAKPAKAPKAPKASSGRGTKLALITALLTRPEGCTGKDVTTACEWPSVSMKQQAEAAGLKLKVDRSSRPFRYWGK